MRPQHHRHDDEGVAAVGLDVGQAALGVEAAAQDERVARAPCPSSRLAKPQAWKSGAATRTTWPSRSGMRSSKRRGRVERQGDGAARGALGRARRPRGEDRDAARRRRRLQRLGVAGGQRRPAPGRAGGSPGARHPSTRGRPRAAPRVRSTRSSSTTSATTCSRRQTSVTCGAANEGLSRTASAPSLATPRRASTNARPSRHRIPTRSPGPTPACAASPRATADVRRSTSP